MAVSRKQVVAVRYHPKSLDAVDDVIVEGSLEEQADRSNVLRAALTVALRHKPELIETIREQM